MSAPIVSTNHRDAQAAAAVLRSPFNEAAILVHNGCGDTSVDHRVVGLVEAAKINRIDPFAHLRTTLERIAKGYPETTKRTPPLKQWSPSDHNLSGRDATLAPCPPNPVLPDMEHSSFVWHVLTKKYGTRHIRLELFQC